MRAFDDSAAFADDAIAAGAAIHSRYRLPTGGGASQATTRRFCHDVFTAGGVRGLAEAVLSAWSGICERRSFVLLERSHRHDIGGGKTDEMEEVQDR